METAAYVMRSKERAAEAGKEIMTRLEHTQEPELKVRKIYPPHGPNVLDECPTISTNDAALWSLDAIYMQEVIPLGN